MRAPSRWQVVLAWLLWPLVVALLNLALAPGTPCAPDADCAPSRSWWRAALWIGAAVAVPALVTALYRSRPRPADSDPTS